MFATRVTRLHRRRPAVSRELSSRSIEPLSELGPAVSPHAPSIPAVDATADAPGSVRRNFNEAAHKLGYWPVRPAAQRPSTEPSDALRAAADDNRDVVAHAGRTVLALGALGIVYGDIGTSPLYAEQVIFTAHANAARTTSAGVYGVVSLIFWTLMILVSIKYAGIIMRAHNRGDGAGQTAPGDACGRAGHPRHLRGRTVLR